jgi:hypothetical protein
LAQSYLLKHTTRQTKVQAVKIHHRVNVNTLAEEHASQLEMNEIASVEFAANLPLFFDPYASNRTTGSFILIDALSNATVGAGMIEQYARAKPASGMAEHGALGNLAQFSVKSQERYARHGHYPAVFLLANRPALGARLERVLFEDGFEVLHVTAREADPDTLPRAVDLAQRAGWLLLYSGEPVSEERSQEIASEASGRFFDLSGAGASAGQDEIIRRILALAETLRIAGRP